MSKSIIRIIISILLIALAIVCAIETAYGVESPSVGRIICGTFMICIIMLCAKYAVEPSILNKRVYGIMVCISAHMTIKYKYQDNIITSKDIKRSTLFKMTGCHSYWELYKYASQKEYFKKDDNIK